MRNRLKRGMTLVEVVVASTIFMIFCAGFYAVYITSLRTHKIAGDHYRATLIARNRIQRALSFDYGSLPLMAETLRPVDSDGNPLPNGQYRRTTLVNTNFGFMLTKMEVEVYYPHKGTNLSLQPIKVSTLITDKF